MDYPGNDTCRYSSRIDRNVLLLRFFHGTDDSIDWCQRVNLRMVCDRQVIDAHWRRLFPLHLVRPATHIARCSDDREREYNLRREDKPLGHVQLDTMSLWAIARPCTRLG